MESLDLRGHADFTRRIIKMEQQFSLFHPFKIVQ